MISEKNISKAYLIFMDLLVGIGVAFLVFNFPMNTYNLGQFVGPKMGETIFEFTHPNSLGKMVYTK